MNKLVSTTDGTRVQDVADPINQPNMYERLSDTEDAMYMASNAFFNVEQIFRTLRDTVEVGDSSTIDRARLAALVQIGIDLTHMHGELIGQTADSLIEVCHG